LNVELLNGERLSSAKTQERKASVMFIDSASSHILNCLHDFLITTAAAEVTRHIIPDLLFRRLWALIEQSFGSENKS
jgi:hypothetical protein